MGDNASISRRAFVAGTAAAATFAMAGNGINISFADEGFDPNAPIEKRHTYCDMCNQVPKCGMTAHVQDGRIVRVESRDPHPVSPICAKGLASIQELYDPNRLLTPKRRTNPKGTGHSEWEDITWEEAYQTIAEQFNRIKEESGPDAVLFYCGDPKEPRGALTRVARLFGSSSLGFESSLCATATQESSRLVYGTNKVTMGVDPSDATASCLMWSLNAAWSQPNRHKSLMAAKERGCKFVIVDPRITPTVTGLADIHLQLRPGSDGALALGFMNILIRDGLYDKDFVENWTHGFEELKELAAQYTPDVVEKITWVPADKLEAAVHLIAENTPSTLVSSSAGLAHSTNVGSAQRAVFMIPALLGMVDVKGGLWFGGAGLPIAGDVTGVGTSQFLCKDIYADQGFADRRLDKEDFPVWHELETHMQMARLPEYVEAGKIRAGLFVATNVMIWPQSHLYAEAVRNMDFSVAVDYYERPWTHDNVDLLLPAAMCCERSAPFAVYGRKVFYREPAIQPLGQAKEDWQILLELGCALGYEEECFGGSVEGAFEYILETSGLDVTLDDLKAHIEDGFEIPGEPNTERKYETGGFRPDGEPGFLTPSGKLEFDSEIIKKHGLDSLPVYKEPVHSPQNGAEEDAAYPLVLCTGSRVPYYTHSKLREIPWLNQFMPEPVVRLHPDDAEARGIASGDNVRVFNQLGEVFMKAEVTNIVHPGAVDVFHGWHQANINELISRDFCPVTGFPPFRSAICEIEKA